MAELKSDADMGAYLDHFQVVNVTVDIPFTITKDKHSKDSYQTTEKGHQIVYNKRVGLYKTIFLMVLIRVLIRKIDK
jgi:hypothetical protein